VRDKGQSGGGAQPLMVSQAEAAGAALSVGDAEAVPSSRRRRRILRIARRPTSAVSFLGVALLIVLALGGERLAPYGATPPDRGNQLSAPSLQHLFGTDNL